ncbi:MAG: glycosyltransferase family 4 protein [Acidobacteria bacterium]|nr:glycosyltransferase family 4 protein [Acidobacteriota bacterium]
MIDAIRIGIDCKPLQEGAAGVRTYLRNLLPALASCSGVNLVCFFSAAYGTPDLPAGAETKRVIGPWINNWIWMQWQLPVAVSQSRRAAGRQAAGIERSGVRAGSASCSRAQSRGLPDLFHFPAYTASSWLACRKVVTVHDVSYAAYPHWYPHAGGKLRRRFYRRSAEGADAIITTSNFSKSEIVRVYSIKPERVFAIYLASGLESVQPALHWERQGLSRSYLLHVGDQHTRRNLLTALSAFQAILPEHDLDFVFIGRDLGVREEMRQHARTLGCDGRIHFLQDLPLAQMPHWYRNAAALVYPSVYEGFGLPLLEAMQLGCPVVGSRASSIPEVTGDAAWLVDPLSAREIAAGIRTILQRPEVRESLQNRGFERVRHFGWKTTAQQTVRAYRRALKLPDSE